MIKPDHNFHPGPLNRCQISGSGNLFEAIDLGCQPSAGALLTKDDLRQPETYYPLRLMICPDCGLGQLDYAVDPKILFSAAHYVYRTGISEPLRTHLRSLASEIVSQFHLPPQSLCVDIGSNDGTLLTFFRDLRMKTLGVEPTNMAKIAQTQNQIETLQEFFAESAAKKIASRYGKARVITFTNVFAHISDLGEVMEGLRRLLDEDGVVMTESQYLLDAFERNQFDQIYHEHVRIYSLKSLVKLFPYYGMEVFDAHRITAREGGIRIYASWKGKRPISREVGRLIKAEEDAGLFRPEGWQRFRAQVKENREKLFNLAYEAKSKGLKFVADSCPTRGVV